jgi:hypothetical protein
MSVSNSDEPAIPLAEAEYRAEEETVEVATEGSGDEPQTERAHYNGNDLRIMKDMLKAAEVQKPMDADDPMEKVRSLRERQQQAKQLTDSQRSEDQVPKTIADAPQAPELTTAGPYEELAMGDQLLLPPRSSRRVRVPTTGVWTIAGHAPRDCFLLDTDRRLHHPSAQARNLPNGRDVDLRNIYTSSVRVVINATADLPQLVPVRGPGSRLPTPVPPAEMPRIRPAYYEIGSPRFDSTLATLYGKYPVSAEQALRVYVPTGRILIAGSAMHDRFTLDGDATRSTPSSIEQLITGPATVIVNCNDGTSFITIKRAPAPRPP